MFYLPMIAFAQKTIKWIDTNIRNKLRIFISSSLKMANLGSVELVHQEYFMSATSNLN